MHQYDLKLDFKIKVVPWANESVWLDAWLQTKRWSLWPIFHGSVIIPQHTKYVERYIVFVFPSLHLSFHASVLHCDLYFMAPNFEEFEGANRFPPVRLSIHLSPPHTTPLPPHPHLNPHTPSPPPPKKKEFCFPLIWIHTKNISLTQAPSPPHAPLTSREATITPPMPH